jgi:hypothetical protein
VGVGVCVRARVRACVRACVCGVGTVSDTKELICIDAEFLWIKFGDFSTYASCCVGKQIRSRQTDRPKHNFMKY